MDIFKLICPTEFRYSVEELKDYLSEDAFIRYKVKIEIALLKTFCEFGIIKKKNLEEIEKLEEKINPEEIYKEEKKIKHDIRALVNVIKKYVPSDLKPYIHFCATSYDIVDTARSLMIKDASENVIIPDMLKLEKILIEIAEREKDTLQIGRTHGQHAEPITFGFYISNYVERWGNRILKVIESKNNFIGKFSGAVGAYNAISMIIKEPEKFEKKLIENLRLKVSNISSQIVIPEPMVDFLHSIVSSFGVLGNISDDMRNLQRTEIGEVGEFFEEKQVGSSTMPQKRNPINFENIKSAWKTFMPKMVTAYMDQISEHQRDLTNSLSQRYIPELLVIFDSSLKRMIKTLEKLNVDKKNMKKNFEISRDKIIAEPLQILLSYYGDPDAHEKVRKLVLQSYETGENLIKIVEKDEEIKKYMNKFTEEQKEAILNPEKYTGISSKKVEIVCNYWREKLNL